jgi:hypothetical protein
MPAKPKAPGTTPTQMRLGDDTKAKIETIRERFGLPSMAAAVRFAVDRLDRELGRKGKVKP